MKSRLFIPATLALFAAALPAFAEPTIPTEPKEAPKEVAAPSVKPEEFTKTLLGAWRQDIDQGEAKGHAITTYLEDGKATSSAHFEAGDKELNITAKAKWTLEGNKLKVEITESSMPEMMPAGTKIEQTIVSLSEKEFRYIQDGKEITEKRLKAETEKAVPAK
jgi:hypothetical protein